MMFQIKINNQVYDFEEKITLKDLAKNFNKNAIIAKVNNRLRELNYYINYNCEVEFLDLTNSDAVRVYETSMRYLVIMALENLYPDITIRFGQCISRSIACNVDNIKVNKVFIDELEKEMNRLVSLDLPIERYTISIDEARKLYTKKGYFDKVELLKYRSEDKVNVYKCKNFINYMFGYMVPSTGYLDKFKIRFYYPGFNIQIPRAECNGEIAEYKDAPVFGKMIQDALDWSNLCKCQIIPNLNDYASKWEVVDLVTMCETRHSNMLAELGELIKSKSKDVRLVCIAGPSSSGKTTFSHRLRIELLTKGLKPVKISMDDYYVNREDTPLGEDGKPVYETYKPYQEFLEKADGGDYVTSLSAKVCMDQEKAYYTSPAFNGSSEARDQVNEIINGAFTIPENTADIKAAITQIFQDAIDECEYNFGK